MHLLVEQLGDINELVADVLGKILAVEIGQRVLAHDAGVDALQQQDVGDRLHRAAAHHRQNPQSGAVVEHGGEIGADLGVGRAERAGHQAHRVGVELVGQIALGRGAIFEQRLEGIADGARIDAAAHRPEELPVAVVKRIIRICSMVAWSDGLVLIRMPGTIIGICRPLSERACFMMFSRDRSSPQFFSTSMMSLALR